MTRKNVIFSILLFVLTGISAFYLQLEMPMRAIAYTYYNPIPLLFLRAIFPLFWGMLLFLLMYFLILPDVGKHFVRIIIECVFLLINIASIIINFHYFLAVSTYLLILAGILLISVILGLVQLRGCRKNTAQQP
jgi:hypothetical protein